jgi:O-antigen/teichoic acid export membrane protein
VLMIAAFSANAGLAFVLGLVVAHFLGPESFGRYGVAMALAVVVNTVLFEWLRLSATRFYSDRSRQADPGIRATLELGYALAALALAGLVAAAFAAGTDLGLPTTLLAAATLAGLGMGLFDYQAALARARFLEGTYAGLVLLKNAFAFLLMTTGAWRGEPALVLLGSAVAAGAAVLIARRRLADPQARYRFARRDVAVSFAAYALPLVAANLLYQVMPLMNRATLAARDGFGEAGQFALAADVGLRLFMTVGSALDILLFQLAVRADEASGRAAAEDQVARNVAIVAAVLAPFAAGLWLVLPAIEALIVPAAFRGPFAAYMNWFLPGFLAFALIQYALNPAFQLRRRTGPVVAAAVVALALNGALLAVLPGRMGPMGVAAAQLAGLAAAAAIVAGLAWCSGLRLPWRDLGLVTVAVAAMVAAVLPLRGLDPVPLLAAAVPAGIAVYGGLAVLFDVAGLRGLVLGRLRPRLTPAARSR